jgi:CheY-like chemotaxis protein
MASGAAHDLNHALHLIVLRVATLQADPRFSGARPALEALAEGADDAARIVGRLQGCVRQPHGQARARSIHGHRILIIDDPADNLDVFREVLELEGQEVEAAPSGLEALALIELGERFDLVLCDVGMPEMNGWQVAAEIHRLAPGTPVWMLTGWAHEIGSGDPRRQLVEGVLAKPIDLEELRELLAEPALERVTH